MSNSLGSKVASNKRILLKKHKNSSKKRGGSRRISSESNRDPSSNSSSINYCNTIPKDLEYLNPFCLPSGMMLLGMVKACNSRVAKLVLPGAVNATLKLEEISDVVNSKSAADEYSLENYIHVGDIITVVVIAKLDNSLQVSARESLLNRFTKQPSVGQFIAGSIRVIEDYGYSVNLGIENLKGFMPLNEFLTGSETVKVGQPMLYRVKKFDPQNGLVTLSCKRMSECVKANAITNINTLMPGMKVKTSVISVLPNGLWVNFLSNFYGGVDLFNIPPFENSSGFFKFSDLNNVYSVDSTVYNATIVYINPSNHYVALSMLEDLPAKNADCVTSITIGDRLECKCQLVSSKKGALLCSENGTRIQVPSSKIDDEISVESTVQVRIIEYNSFENYYLATAKKSQIKEKFFLYSDLSPGQLIRGKVVKETTKGYVIQLSQYLNAFVSYRDLSDLDSSNMTSRLHEGSLVTGRVLKVDLLKHMASITLRRSLVNSQLPIISNWCEIFVGLITQGTVVKIRDNYCIVLFYNGIRGISNFSNYANEKLKIEDFYKVNQVVRCRVVDFDSERQYLAVSFNFEDSELNEKNSIDLIRNNDFTGTTIEGAEVIRNDENYLKLRYVMNDVPVSLILLHGHLSDFEKWNSRIALSPQMSVGSKIEKVHVYDSKVTDLFVTCKPSLLDSKIPKTLGEFVVGSTYYAFVYKIIESAGLVVKVGHWRGFVNFKNCQIPEVSLSESYHLHQTLVVKLLFVDQNSSKNKLNFSLRSVSPMKYEWLCKYFTYASALNPTPKSYLVGQILEARVSKVEQDRVFLTTALDADEPVESNEFQLSASTQTLISVGSKCKCLVLDIDTQLHLVRVTLDTDVIKFFSNYKSKKQDICLKYCELIIQLVERDYLVLTTAVSTQHALVVYMSTGGYNDAVRRNPNLRYRVGDVINAAAVKNVDGRWMVTGDLSKHATDIKLSSKIESSHADRVEVGALLENLLVSKVSDTICHVKIPGMSNLKAVLSMSEVFDVPLSADDSREQRLSIGTPVSIDQIQKYRDYVKLHSKPLSGFTVGQVIPLARVIAVRSQVATARFTQICISIRPSVLDSTWKDSSTKVQKESIGRIFPVWISEIRDIAMSVQLPIECDPTGVGTVHIMDSDCERYSEYYVGQNVLAVVAYMRKSHPNLSIRAMSSFDGTLSIWNSKQLSTNLVLPCRIECVKINHHVTVSLFSDTIALAYNCDLLDEWTSFPSVKFVDRVGEIFSCKILQVNSEEDGSSRIKVSLRPSVVSRKQAANSSDFAPVETYDEIKVGRQYPGYISSINSQRQTLQVQIGSNVNVLVPFRELSDSALENPENAFSSGQLVRVFVKYLNSQKFKAVGSLKNSYLNSSFTQFEDLAVGQTYRGRITGYCNRGLFVRLENSYLRGLCSYKNLFEHESDDAMSDLDAFKDRVATQFPKGSTYKFCVAKINNDSFNLALVDSSNLLVEEQEHDAKNDTVKSDLNQYSVTNDINFETSLSEDEEDESCAAEQSKTGNQVEKVSVYADFDFEDHSARQSSQESCVKVKHKESSILPAESFVHEEVDLRHEDEIDAKERRMIEITKDQTLVPQSFEEHQKAIVEKPHSSLSWIRFMAYYMDQNEIEKSRQIAEQALKIIPIERVKQTLNIWQAAMNLELQYGNNDSFNLLIEKAIKTNNPKTIYTMAIESKLRFKITEGVVDMYKKILKKWKHCASSWTRFATYYFMHGHAQEARELVDRALNSLAPRKHIKVLLKFSCLEFKYGTSERARTTFETLVSSYPKRTDIWNVWIDLESTRGDEFKTRALFERVISLPLKPVKMKYFFKKYLDYEMKHGTPETIESIKQKARDYIQSKL